ncbi:Dabb family protein [Desulfovibrio sp. OttesenSCG-928-A18]|nr:Dabb family protein [Desulfovibrio sp. OttesenSCG-928-A18]
MFTHIVWWTFKPEAQGRTGEENANLIRERLLALKERIEALKDISVSTQIQEGSTEAAQLVLVTRHDDASGFAAYASHPKHQLVLALLNQCTDSRKTLDFTE